MNIWITICQALVKSYL